MVGFKASILLAATTAVSMVAAQSFSLFEIDPETNVDVAGGLAVLSAAASSGLDDCLDSCNDRDNCIGFIFDPDFTTTDGFCTTFRYDVAGFTSIDTGYERIGWRYNTPAGPTCDLSAGDIIPTPSGACLCDDSRVQDGPYGCRAASAASQVVRRRSTRSMIMPGQHRRATF